MKIPGPDHPISITSHSGRVTVTLGGRMLADTRNALALKEAAYPAVYYIPRDDAHMTFFERTDHTTHCQYKGAASYYSIKPAGAQGTNAIWSYEDPYPAVAEIKGHLAFYPDKVTITVE